MGGAGMGTVGGAGVGIARWVGQGWGLWVGQGLSESSLLLALWSHMARCFLVLRKHWAGGLRETRMRGSGHSRLVV